jgi:hypothetical protein
VTKSVWCSVEYDAACSALTTALEALGILQKEAIQAAKLQSGDREADARARVNAKHDVVKELQHSVSSKRVEVGVAATESDGCSSN